MSAAKSALLFVFMMTGIALWGVGIYSADASSQHVVTDGYGISASPR